MEHRYAMNDGLDPGTTSPRHGGPYALQIWPWVWSLLAWVLAHPDRAIRHTPQPSDHISGPGHGHRHPGRTDSSLWKDDDLVTAAAPRTQINPQRRPPVLRTAIPFSDAEMESKRQSIELMAINGAYEAVLGDDDSRANRFIPLRMIPIIARAIPN